jgi:hypothetical protein
VTDAETVDAAMIEHLSKEVERLEAENSILKDALARPVQVMAPTTAPPASYVDQQVVQALQNIQYAVQSMSGAMSVLSSNPRVMP